MSLIFFQVALQTKFRDFRQFEVNDLTWGHKLCKTRKTEYHSLSFITSNMLVFCFAALGHLGAILPEMAKYSIVIDWKNSKRSATDGFCKKTFWF